MSDGCSQRRRSGQGGEAHVSDGERTTATRGRDDVGHPRLTLGSTTYPLTKSRTRIGRGAGVDISVEDVGVSRSHAEIVLGIPTVIRDLGSTNGTSVDGRPIAEAPLHDGATITVGSTTFSFRTG